MAKKQVALEVAAFLDSDQAQELAGPSRDQVRRIAELFLAVCYEELGSEPRQLDGQDVHAALAHALPRRLKRADPLAEHVPAVLHALFDHVEEARTMPQAFEARRGLEESVDEFLETVRSGREAQHGGPKDDPFVHGAAKLGRNDPCSCGSGKKYKKCHGRNA